MPELLECERFLSMNVIDVRILIYISDEQLYNQVGIYESMHRMTTLSLYASLAQEASVPESINRSQALSDRCTRGRYQ